jgi:ABC-type glutathione transport system ATPase component
MNDTRLIVKDLHIQFEGLSGKNTVVNGINFELKKGSILGIVGESGSGKSLTALSIINMIKQTGATVNGHVFIDGTDVLALSEKQMRVRRGKDVAMIFQDPLTSLNPLLKIGIQIIETIQSHDHLNKREAYKKALSILQSAGLENPEKMMNKYPFQLSGGMRQRVMIAIAFSSNPKILIADEPTTALDVTLQDCILNRLREIRVQHKTSVIIISHDLGVIADIADDIVVMKEGVIVESGSKEDILNQPKHPYTKKLLNAMLTIDQNTSGHVRENISEKRVILEAENVSKIYESIKWFERSAEKNIAVNNVNVAIKRGETLGLVGGSGCGKSTLSKLICKLEVPSSGNIFYDGKTIYEMSKYEEMNFRKEVQIIFQDSYSSFNPRQTIAAIIEEPLRNFNYGPLEARQQRINQLLELVQLNVSEKNKFPHELSGGQRQRVNIARALAFEPKLLICDEPVSSLDVTVQKQILDLLKQLKKTFDISILFISHDLSVVKYMSDRIAVMESGRLIEVFNQDMMFKMKHKPYTMKLLESIPNLYYK